MKVFALLTANTGCAKLVFMILRRDSNLNSNNFEKQFYIALYNIIDKFYKNDKNEFIAELASEMCPYTFKDSISADSAVYEDFSDCLHFCFAESENEDISTAFNASIRFLKMYRDEFGFEIDNYIEQLSIDLYKQEFEKLSYF